MSDTTPGMKVGRECTHGPLDYKAECEHRVMCELGEVLSAPKRLHHPSGARALEYVPYLTTFLREPRPNNVPEVRFEVDGQKFITLTDAVGSYTWELFDAYWPGKEDMPAICVGRRVDRLTGYRDMASQVITIPQAVLTNSPQPDSLANIEQDSRVEQAEAIVAWALDKWRNG